MNSNSKEELLNYKNIFNEIYQSHEKTLEDMVKQQKEEEMKKLQNNVNKYTYTLTESKLNKIPTYRNKNMFQAFQMLCPWAKTNASFKNASFFSFLLKGIQINEYEFKSIKEDEIRPLCEAIIESFKMIREESPRKIMSTYYFFEEEYPTYRLELALNNKKPYIISKKVEQAFWKIAEKYLIEEFTDYIHSVTKSMNFSKDFLLAIRLELALIENRFYYTNYFGNTSPSSKVPFSISNRYSLKIVSNLENQEKLRNLEVGFHLYSPLSFSFKGPDDIIGLLNYLADNLIYLYLAPTHFIMDFLQTLSITIESVFDKYSESKNRYLIDLIQKDKILNNLNNIIDIVALR